MSNFKFHAQRQPWTDSVALSVAQRVGEDLYSVYLTTAAKIEPGMATMPAMTLDMNAAQQLMDELWGAGIRPSEGSGAAGHIAAMKAHLEDMRRLAFQNIPELATGKGGSW